ncbi:M1 family metallopeptidase [bacterium]|nr:M1 family metallopeptidase [bacterium]
MARIDPHSYADPAQGVIDHAHIELVPDFDTKKLFGRVALTLKKPHMGGVLHLDTRDLDVRKITANSKSCTWKFTEKDSVLGSCLEIQMPEGARSVVIEYVTSPKASALQWLPPEQTFGKKHPYLYTQFQFIHARSVMPIQDTPSVRITYDAAIVVPQGLASVMSGNLTEVIAGDSVSRYCYKMPSAVPAYLIGFAVGNIRSFELGPRTRVWAEPEILDAAAWEFVEADRMLLAGEELFGTYWWNRYDFVLMPRAFPFGGMENAQLSFLTSGRIAGDRSLTDVLPHELAHSWTGNLVTNATLDHFWLNEGFTVWAERRITEKLYGAERASLSAALGRRHLEEEFKRFGYDSPMTRLKTDLKGKDPDQEFSSVPYEKGFLFAALLERSAGREVFDAFMRSYMKHFAFTSITSEQFLEYLEQKLPGLVERTRASEWVYGSGLPDNAPAFHSEILAEIEQYVLGFESGPRPNSDTRKRWGVHGMLVYLNEIPHKLSAADISWLEEALDIRRSRNTHLLAAWFRKTAASGYVQAFGEMKTFLRTEGRLYTLKYIYAELMTGGFANLAKGYFEECAPLYHPITRQIIEGIVCKGNKA